MDSMNMAKIDTALNGLKSSTSDDHILYLNIPAPPDDVNEDCSRY